MTTDSDGTEDSTGNSEAIERIEMTEREIADHLEQSVEAMLTNRR